MGLGTLTTTSRTNSFGAASEFIPRQARMPFMRRLLWRDLAYAELFR